jgi:hypothetical protein
MSSGGIAGISFILGAGFAIMTVLLWHILREVRRIARILETREKKHDS